MRGVTVDKRFMTVQGGPFPDNVTSYITFLYGPREPIQTEPVSDLYPEGIWTGYIDPATGIRVDYHYGLDLWPLNYGDGSGCPLVALGYGRVTDRTVDDGPVTGNSIEVEYKGEGHTFRVRYWHLNASPFTSVGDFVTPGQVLGFTGETGKAKGAHLHLELHIDDYITDPLQALSVAQELGFIPMPEIVVAVDPTWPTPDMQWVAEGWGSVYDAPWRHRYPMRVKVLGHNENIELHRTGRVDDEWEHFDLVVQDLKDQP